MATDLVQEGIEAFKAGDKARAAELLAQAVREPENKMNEQAWYYLAAAQSDPARRKQALEVVLRINPNNTRAQDALAKVNAQLGGGDAVASAAPASKPKRKVVEYSGDDVISPPTSGFKLPVDIPDAPEFVDFGYIFAVFSQIFQSGLAILQKKEGAYEAELNRATWWRFWVYLGVGSIIIALLAMVGSFFGVYRAIVIALIYLIFTIPITLITYYASAYISHNYATKSAGGQGELVHHAYVAILPGLTAGIIGAVLSAIPIVNIIGWFIAILLSLYALFIMVDGFEIIHGYERNKAWITAAIMVIAQILVGGVLGGILGAIIASIYIGTYMRF